MQELNFDDLDDYNQNQSEHNSVSLYEIIED